MLQVIATTAGLVTMAFSRAAIGDDRPAAEIRVVDDFREDSRGQYQLSGLAG